jgi:hypothetical protein
MLSQKISLSYKTYFKNELYRIVEEIGSVRHAGEIGSMNIVALSLVVQNSMADIFLSKVNINR